MRKFNRNLLLRLSLEEFESLSDLIDTFKGHSITPKILQNYAQEQGVAGLIYNNLQKLDPGEVNRYMPLKFFEKIFFTNVLNSIIAQQTIKKLGRCFNHYEIQVILFKGPDLTQKVYKQQSGLRFFSDIDFVVKKKDWHKITEILNSFNFYSCPHHTHVFTDGQIDIDLHLEPFGISRIHNRALLLPFDYQKLWCNIKKHSDFSGLFEFPLEDYLLILIVHGLKHSFHKIIWWIDILKFIESFQHQINWDLFLNKVQRTRLQRPIFYLFKKVPQRLLPENYLSELKPDQSKKVMNLFYSNLIKHELPLYTAELIYFFEIPSVMNKLKFLCEVVFLRKNVRSQIHKNIFYFFIMRFLKLLQACLSWCRYLILRKSIHVIYKF